MDLREQVLEESEYSCILCGNKDRECLDVHHVIPKAKGGLDIKENLCVLCSNCHRKVHRGSIDLIKEIYG